MTTSNSKYLILACDGGGIRGLIPALLLQTLNQSFPSFLGNVYLLAGTSTGGIISLALASNVSTDEIVSLYETDGAAIFTPSTCMSGKSANPPTPPPQPASVTDDDWWQYILTHLLDLICVWYDNSGLRTTIANVLGASANATLDSLVPANNPRYVLVNTLQLCNSQNIWTPLQLTNLPNISGNTSGGTLVIDAALSTSAAPIYFPPYPHPTYGFCSDGGLFANNPGTIALTTLVESGVPLENIWMLSLNTGNVLDCYPPSLVSKSVIGTENDGPLFWFWPTSQTSTNNGQSTYTPSIPLLSALMDGTSEVDAYQCGQLLGTRYQRANVPLSQPIELDDYNPAAITAMKNSVSSYTSSSSEWSGILSWIKSNFT